MLDIDHALYILNPNRVKASSSSLPAPAVAELLKVSFTPGMMTSIAGMFGRASGKAARYAGRGAAAARTAGAASPGWKATGAGMGAKALSGLRRGANWAAQSPGRAAAVGAGGVAAGYGALATLDPTR